MKTTASYFTGGGLFDVGARRAGLNPIWGVEYDDKIAEVARVNGLSVITADVIKINPADLVRPDHFHASPPCPNFSVAKAGAKETKEDIAMAAAVCRFLEYHKPDHFTLENVYRYRLSKSFALILETLDELKYKYEWKHVCAADYGVPQTRRRLILIASRLGGVDFPKPTHAKGGKGGLLTWNGWYKAVEDLISSLPESKFADWQLKRFPQELTDNIFIDGKPSNYKGDLQILDGVDRINTITSSQEKHPLRAFLIENGNSSSARPHLADEPSPTVSIGHQAGLSRAWLSKGRVVSMTPRALARFQSVPDTYILPDNATLACKIIGNGVPCLLSETIIRSLIHL